MINRSVRWMLPRPLGLAPSSLALLPLQPVLHRIVVRVAAENPALFERLGPHGRTRFLIVVDRFPFFLFLRPDPARPELKALPRRSEPAHDVRIAGRLPDLLSLLDGRGDGDSLFFSRDLDITGNVEAVVCLRNALDDVEGSIADQIAGLFGPPGRLALGLMRRTGPARPGMQGAAR